MPVIGDPGLGTGVYMIRNKVNGKVYIGSAAKSLKQRWKDHRRFLIGGWHNNRHLLSAWKKYGEDAFQFYVIEYCLPESCTSIEQYWIDFYRSQGQELYNLYMTAGSPLGSKHSEESKKVMSEKAKLRDNHYKPGHKHSPVASIKMSLARRGKKQSEEARAKKSASLKAFYADPTRSAAVREKFKKRKTTAGYRHTEETKQKMREAKAAYLKKRREQNDRSSTEEAKGTGD